MNSVIILLLFNIWPSHFVITSSMMITLLLLDFQLFDVEHFIIWQFNYATIMIFGNFPKLVQHLKMDYSKYFQDNNVKKKLQWKMQEEKRQQKTTIGATHLCNANWNHAKVMALINYK